MSLTPARLRRITRHRRRLERLQEQQFALARQATVERERAAAAAVQAHAAALDEGGQACGPVDLALLGSASAYLVRTRRTIAAREAALRQSRVAEEAVRETLLDRRRDRKATETLLDARLADDRRRREQMEARRIDESATHNWQRAKDLLLSPPWEGASG
jgi:hypothetical protein